jgi:ABC-2 type transport system permease protein
VTNTIAPQGALATTWLIAEREIRMRLRSKAFVISTAILLFAVLASIVIGSIVSGNAEPDKIAAVGSAVATVESTGAFDVVEADDRAEAEELVRSGEVEAAVLPDAESPTGVSVVALEDAPGGLIGALSISPSLDLLEPAEQDPFLVYIVSFGFALAFFLSALTFGQIIAQSVVEEKQTRIVEILMAAVPTRYLLAGKIVGNSLLAFAQIAGISALAGIALLATGQDLILADVGPSLVWFVIFFAAGFVMLAALYAAAAALVSRTEDLGSALMPVTLLVMIPYFGVIFFQDNDLALAIMSYVPFAAPVGMPMRVFLGTAQWWEPLLSLAILLATTVVVILVGSRIYANGLLRMGGRVKFKDALVTT